MEEFLFIIGLILLNELFSMSEVALISARKTRLTAEAEKGNLSAKAALKLTKEPNLFLSHLAYPCVLLLSRSTTFVYKMIGMKENDTKVTEEEIKTMIQGGAEDGEVQPMEQDIMQRVLMIGDLNILRKKHKRPI